jgi:hypothetical protein
MMSSKLICRTATVLIALLANAETPLKMASVAGRQDATHAGTEPHRDQGPLILRAEVVDSEGHPVDGADVVAKVGYSRGPAENEIIFERTRTDGDGRARLEFSRERRGALAYFAEAWAHPSGLAMTTSPVSVPESASIPTIRLTLERPAIRTITVFGQDDRPVAGLRVVPKSLRDAPRRLSGFEIPDEWIDRFAATTDANGVTTLSSLPLTVVPMAIPCGGRGARGILDATPGHLDVQPSPSGATPARRDAGLANGTAMEALVARKGRAASD